MGCVFSILFQARVIVVQAHTRPVRRAPRVCLPGSIVIENGESYADKFANGRLRECFLKELPEAAFAENPGYLRGLTAKRRIAANQAK